MNSILILLFICVSSTSVSSEAQKRFNIAASGTIYFVSPSGSGEEFSIQNPGSVVQALEKSSAGDTIKFLPGTYSKIEISVSGLPEKPITLISDSNDPDQFAIIDGGSTEAYDHEGLFFTDASWIVIENLKFRNCWRDIILLYNSSYITVRGCDFKEGQDVIKALRDSHHILLEHNVWEQNIKIWTEWDWDDIHHGEVTDLDHYNGSFYDGHSGLGAAVIRHNQIRYAFNGIQLWASSPQNQANNEIYSNHFEYIRDNAFEPESYAANLHFYHNMINSVEEGIFSFLHGSNDSSDAWDETKFAGNGPIYVYGNVGFFDYENPSVDGVGNSRQRVIKTVRWLKDEDSPLHFYHNSWNYGTLGLDVKPVGDRRIMHFNNIGNFVKGYSINSAFQFSWGNAFDYDYSNMPWSSLMTNNGQEQKGIVAADPGWYDGKGDFRLKPASICIDKGKVIEGFTQWYDGDAPDIGAYEGDKLVEGPPFFVMEPPGGLGYVEKPRITRQRINGSQLTLFWSWPLVPESLSADAIVLIVNGQIAEVTNIQMGGTNREVILSTDLELQGSAISIDFSTLPMGENGESATMWASPLALERDYITAVSDDQQITRSFQLQQNYPNPFNNQTLIRYILAQAGYVRIEIINVLGKSIMTLEDAYQSAGSYKIIWNADAFSSGIYFCRLRFGGQTDFRKMVYLK